MQVGGRETHNSYFYGINCTFYFIFIFLFCSSFFLFRSIAALTEKLSAISHPDKASVSVSVFFYYYFVALYIDKNHNWNTKNIQYKYNKNKKKNSRESKIILGPSECTESTES